MSAQGSAASSHRHGLAGGLGPWLRRGAACALLGLLAAAGATAQPVWAARVNGAGIALDLVDRQFEELLRERRLHISRLQDPAKAKGLKREALESLIRIELLWQQARAEDLVVSDAEVERALAEVRGRFRNPEAFARRIEQSGFSVESYRVHSRKLLSGERLAQRVVDRAVQVGDQDIEDFYAANPRLFSKPEQLRVRQILVAAPAQAGSAQREQARRKAAELLARVRAGESFEALARAHSDDATRQWGGELDPFAAGDKPRAFEEAAFALAPGAVSDLVETAAGYHIIKQEQRIAAVSVGLAEARERIRHHLHELRAREAIDQEVQRLRAAGKVEILLPL